MFLTYDRNRVAIPGMLNSQKFSSVRLPTQRMTDLQRRSRRSFISYSHIPTGKGYVILHVGWWRYSVYSRSDWPSSDCAYWRLMLTSLLQLSSPELNSFPRMKPVLYLDVCYFKSWLNLIKATHILEAVIPVQSYFFISPAEVFMTICVDKFRLETFSCGCCNKQFVVKFVTPA
jgi:hypothetical protein